MARNKLTVIETDHGQMMIDMPVGRERTALVAAARKIASGKGAGRPGPWSIDLASAWSNMGRDDLAEIARSCERASRELAAARRETRTEGPRPTDPITVDCLIDLALAMGNRWGAAVLRSAHLLRLDVPPNGRAADGVVQPDGSIGSRFYDGTEDYRQLTPGELRTLGARMPKWTWLTGENAGQLSVIDELSEGGRDMGRQTIPGGKQVKVGSVYYTYTHVDWASADLGSKFDGKGRHYLTHPDGSKWYAYGRGVSWNSRLNPVDPPAVVDQPDDVPVAPERCAHVTGQPGCPVTVTTCAGIPDVVDMPADVTRVPDVQTVAECGAVTGAREIADALREYPTLSGRVSDIVSSTSKTDMGHRFVTVTDMLVAGHLVRVVYYRSHSPLQPELPARAVYVDGELIEGEARGTGGRDAIARVSMIILRALRDRGLAPAASGPVAGTPGGEPVTVTVEVTRLSVGTQIRQALETLGLPLVMPPGDVIRYVIDGREMTPREACDYLIAGGYSAAFDGRAETIVNPDRLAERDARAATPEPAPVVPDVEPVPDAPADVPAPEVQAAAVVNATGREYRLPDGANLRHTAKALRKALAAHRYAKDGPRFEAHVYAYRGERDSITVTVDPPSSDPAVWAAVDAALARVFAEVAKTVNDKARVSA